MQIIDKKNAVRVAGQCFFMKSGWFEPITYGSNRTEFITSKWAYNNILSSPWECLNFYIILLGTTTDWWLEKWLPIGFIFINWMLFYQSILDLN